MSNRRRRMRVGGSIAFLLSLGLGIGVSAPASAGSQLCPPQTITASSGDVGLNFAALLEVSVRDDCTVAVSPVKVVPLAQAPISLPGGSVFGKSHAAHKTGDPVATVYNRSWDCCGIQMNALYTSYDWSDNGSVVTTSNNQWNTTWYHTEAWPSRGWWLDYQQLYYSAGCNGCTSRTLTGKAGFAYQGVFDPTGTLFYNTYVNTMRGQGNGGYYCTYSVNWRHSAPGWHSQQWCAFGYNGSSG